MSAYTETVRAARVITNDRGNYWRYYGLQRDPFTLSTEDNAVYLPSRWEQYFDLLHYLCDSNNVLLVVTGLKGSGKTTFLQQLLTEVNETKNVCRLNGASTLNTAQLKAALLNGFSLPQPSGETLEEQLDSLVADVQAKALPCLLIVDDAHRLPEETLRTLLHMIKQQSENHMRLHVLLLGEPRLKNILAFLAEREGDRELVHNSVLEPFNLEETKKYLKHRLTAAGLPAAMPLSQSTIARIYSLSEGVPARINAVARQALIDGMQQRQLYTLSDFVRTRRTQLLGGSVVLAGLIATAFTLAHNPHYATSNLHNLFSRHSTAATVQISTPRVTASAMQSNTIVIPSAIVGSPQRSVAVEVAVRTTPSSTPVISTEHYAMQSNQPAAKPFYATLLNKVKQDFTVSHHVVHAMQIVHPAAQIPAVNFAHAVPVPLPTIHRMQVNKMQTDNAPIVTAPTAMPVPVADTATDNGSMLDQQVATELTKEISASPMLPSTVKSTSVSSQPAQSAHPVQPTQATKVQLTQPKPAQIVAPVSMTQAAPKLQPIPSAQPTVAAVAANDNDPFASANPHHYTVQLIAMANVDALKQFATANQLAGQLNYVRVSRQGKDWYVAVYGQYASAAEAHAAIQQLPQSVQDQKPWVRSIASVQQAHLLTAVKPIQKVLQPLVQAAPQQRMVDAQQQHIATPQKIYFDGSSATIE